MNEYTEGPFLPPFDWAAAYDRMSDEVKRRDLVLDWLAANAPRTLELCPYKLDRRFASPPAAGQEGKGT
jgi:hypothetical protein